VRHESLAALHIQRQHKIDKDDKCRRKKDDWTFLGQVEFGRAEQRHSN
jgi:hypothetical protein